MFDPEPLFHLSPNISMHWANPENPSGERGAGGRANFGRKGAAGRGTFPSGETWELASAQGTGVIRRVWFTMMPRVPASMRGIVIRMYWDGASTPAVEAPLGDFFGSPLARNAVFESAWFSNHEARCFLSYLPMPFRRGFRMTVTNESPVNVNIVFHQVDYTLGDELPESASMGYLHAYWNRENPTTLRRDFEVLPRVEGRGRYLGANFGVIAHGPAWWGEGEVKIYLDGDTDLPTLCGTGTEDYINTAWGQRRFNGLWGGCPVADTERRQFTFYRHHGPDPIFFQQHCRITIQQIGWEFHNRMAKYMDEMGLDEISIAGDGSRKLTRADLRGLSEDLSPTSAGNLFERQDDWCSTAYFYLDKPEGQLPRIATYEARVADLTGDVVAVERQDA